MQFEHESVHVRCQVDPSNDTYVGGDEDEAAAEGAGAEGTPGAVVVAMKLGVVNSEFDDMYSDTQGDEFGDACPVTANLPAEYAPVQP